MQDSTLDSTPLVGPLDALTNDLDHHGYPQSAQRICTRLFIEEFSTSDPLSQSEIAEKTNLGIATVRRQLDQLEADGYVDSHHARMDLRQRLYRLRSLDID